MPIVEKTVDQTERERVVVKVEADRGPTNEGIW
jgi:hypothetical protein